MTDKSLRDELAEEFVRSDISFGGLEYSLSGNIHKEMVQCFKAGWDACEKELLAEIEQLKLAARPLVNERLIAMTQERDQLKEMFIQQQLETVKMFEERDRWKEMAGKLAIPLKGFVDYAGGFAQDNELGAEALEEFEKMRDGK